MKKVQREALLLAGGKMANTMFNLAQFPRRPLDADLCAKFKAMQVEWDAAVLALAPAPPSPTPPIHQET